MTRALALLLLVLTLSACAVFNPWAYERREAIRQPAVIVVPETYTKAEIDAINAEAACKGLARSSLQASRCGVRR